MEGEHSQLSDLYSTSCLETQRAEADKQLVEDRLSEVTAELKRHSNLVSDLEAELAAQRRAHDLDLELTTITLSSLRDQLASANTSIVSVFIVYTAVGVMSM